MDENRCSGVRRQSLRTPRTLRGPSTKYVELLAIALIIGIRIGCRVVRIIPAAVWGWVKIAPLRPLCRALIIITALIIRLASTDLLPIVHVGLVICN